MNYFYGIYMEFMCVYFSAVELFDNYLGIKRRRIEYFIYITLMYISAHHRLDF